MSSDSKFKMGHGGTLDPLATGVLIVGIGRGTKSLPDFLSGTKTYETVVLFGKTTDTYDVLGQVVADAPHDHVTRDLAEGKLQKFRGHIKQVPPIYSALKINGMKAYDYARSGKPLPRELESRDMTVEECELLEWYEGGQHDFRWPKATASAEDKAVAQKLLNVETQTVQPETVTSGELESKDGAASAPPPESSTADVITPTKAKIQELNSLMPAEKAALHTHDALDLCEEPADAPAARIRLTSSSGFYVRSFAHDLGIACDSYATMSELARVRQSAYTIYDPPPNGQVTCITYEDLKAGEETWGPKITTMLDKWMTENPPVDPSDRIDDRDKPYNNHRKRWSTGSKHQNQSSNKRQRDSDGRARRRNSSSPE